MTAPTRFQISTKAFSDFWEFEDGKSMLAQLGSVPDLSKAYSHVPLLFQKDDIADTVIEECFTGVPFGAALQSATDYASGKSALETAPPSVKALLDEMHATPSWVDRKQLDIGRKVCNRSGKSGLIVLRNYSLMLGYQSAAINKPLIATGALHSGAVKRLADTTAFWYAVTGDGALANGGDGFTYCLRTRIVHAYSRIMIKQRLNWDISDQGEPLNYWDMVATYLGFSLVFLRGLELLGFGFTKQESQAVYHLWKYIGYLIGIPPQLLPDNENEAIESLYLWSKTQPEADEDSIALAQALYLEPLSTPWPPKKWQKKSIQHINVAFNYHLIGKRSCEILQLPHPQYPRFLKPMIAINRADNALGEKFDWYRHWQVKHGRQEQLVIRNRVCF